MNLKESDAENMLTALEPGGIEAQEKRGQSKFVSTEVLPTDMMNGCTIEKLESLGFKFGKKTDDNEMFIECQFPKGWKKVATDHSMWSDLLNEKDEVVANIFYKAAFYDRSSHMWFNNDFKEKYPDLKL